MNSRNLKQPLKSRRQPRALIFLVSSLISATLAAGSAFAADSSAATAVPAPKSRLVHAKKKAKAKKAKAHAKVRAKAKAKPVVQAQAPAQPKAPVPSPAVAPTAPKRVQISQLKKPYDLKLTSRPMNTGLVRESVNAPGSSSGANSARANPDVKAAPSVTGVPAQTSTATAIGNGAATPPNPWSLSFTSVWYGPAVSAPLGAYQPYFQDSADNPAGASNTDSPVFSENTLSLSYKLSDTWSIGPTFFWDTTLGGGKASDGTGAAGSKTPLFDLNDSYLTLSNSSLAKRGTYNLSGSFMYFAPISIVSQNANGLGKFEILLDNSYDIPNSKWKLDLTTYGRVYARHNAPDDTTATKWYFGPSIAYKLSPAFTFSLLYEAITTTHYGVQSDATNPSGPDFFEGEATDVEPGISWTISKKLNVSAWLNIPAGHDERRALDTMQIEGAIGWTIF